MANRIKIYFIIRVPKSTFRKWDENQIICSSGDAAVNLLEIIEHKLRGLNENIDVAIYDVREADSRTWFEKMLEEFKDDPEYIREQIKLWEDDNPLPEKE